MIGDLREVEDGAELDVDLCIVGAGAAGIAIARELARSNLRVLLLESGGLRRTARMDDLNDGETSGIDRASLTEGRGRLFGGATTLWAGQCLPPDPMTFERRDWVANSGWPLTAGELEPFERRAEALFQIGGEPYDEEVWDSFGVERAAVDRERLVHRFSVWCPEPNLARLYRPMLAASSSVQVLLNATVTEVTTTSDGDRFQSVRARTPEGKQVLINARACALCGGGIENARLLLDSDSAHPGGLGNGSDQVGRYFQDHPNLHAGVIHEGDVPRLQELYGLLYRDRIRYLPRLVLSPETQRSEQVLSCAAHPVFHFGEDSGIEAARRIYRGVRSGNPPRGLPRELWRIARDSPRMLPLTYRRAIHGRSARADPVLVTLQTHAEQEPNRESRVTLSARRDWLGRRLPRVDWRLTNLDRRTAEAMVRVAGAELGRLGLGNVRAEPWLAGPRWSERVSDSYHHMGTTRMGTAPATSVINRDGGVHGVEGLYVAGSSVFPAAGFANPTLLIATLAIRLGDHLKVALDRPRSAAA